MSSKWTHLKKLYPCWLQKYRMVSLLVPVLRPKNPGKYTIVSGASSFVTLMYATLRDAFASMTRYCVWGCLRVWLICIEWEDEDRSVWVPLANSVDPFHCLWEAPPAVAWSLHDCIFGSFLQQLECSLKPSHRRGLVTPDAGLWVTKFNFNRERIYMEKLTLHESSEWIFRNSLENVK